MTPTLAEKNSKKPNAPQKRIALRCYVYEQRSGLFVAECIDLDLMVKARKINKAKRELRDAIVGYVHVAHDTGQYASLIPRPSPLSHRLHYYFLRFMPSWKDSSTFDCSSEVFA